MAIKEVSPGRFEVLARLQGTTHTISIIISRDFSTFFDAPLGKSVTWVKDVDSGQGFDIREDVVSSYGKTEMVATPHN